MNKVTINPSLLFYEYYKTDIEKCRERLFLEIGKGSTEFGNEVRKLLDKKLHTSGSPLMGELFPWIISDLTMLNNSITYEISVGWLAIYLYTVFLDEYLDAPTLQTPSQIIAGSLLAKVGLLKISHFTTKTPYEDLVNEALTKSALCEKMDIEYQKKITNHSIKERYSRGKNMVIFSCAYAFASQNERYAGFIIDFTNHLLLALQYLDDIADYDSDFKIGNYTVLLNYALKDSRDLVKSSKILTANELLKELILTGAFIRVLGKINDLLEKIAHLIMDSGLIEDKPSIEFLFNLKSLCSEFCNLLINNRFTFRFKSQKEQQIVLDKVRHYITIIAQSS
ncbi:MAG: hypothetical protein AB2L26_09045 [Ignavibacteria bacterium]